MLKPSSTAASVDGVREGWEEGAAAWKIETCFSLRPKSPKFGFLNRTKLDSKLFLLSPVLISLSLSFSSGQWLFYAATESGNTSKNRLNQERNVQGQDVKSGVEEHSSFPVVSVPNQQLQSLNQSL